MSEIGKLYRYVNPTKRPRPIWTHHDEGERVIDMPSGSVVICLAMYVNTETELDENPTWMQVVYEENIGWVLDSFREPKLFHLLTDEP